MCECVCVCVCECVCVCVCVCLWVGGWLNGCVWVRMGAYAGRDGRKSMFSLVGLNCMQSLHEAIKNYNGVVVFLC